MPEPTADAAADAPDWPRPGDVGYLVGDFDDAKDGRSLDDIRRDLIVFFVHNHTGDRLYFVGATADACGTSGAGWQSLAAHLFEPGCDSIKRTLAGSLRESARKEREYGDKCRVLADTLERLAAESEGGEADAL